MKQRGFKGNPDRRSLEIGLAGNRIDFGADDTSDRAGGRELIGPVHRREDFAAPLAVARVGAQQRFAVGGRKAHQIALRDAAFGGVRGVQGQQRPRRMGL